MANTSTGDKDAAGGGSITFGAIAYEKEAKIFTSWWCSNGLYKHVTTGPAGKGNFIQTFSYNDNQRLELAMVACPNKTDLCGADGYKLLTDNTPFVVKIAASVTLLTTDKCTWVVSSYKMAPTFVVAAEPTKSLGITSAGW